MIRWGDSSDSTRESRWYQLDTKGELWIGAITSSGDSTLEFLVPIDQQKYCSVVMNLNTAFLKTQALYSPGNRARYIEYTNPTSSVYLRAVWNPELQTFQSRDMRAQYDSLMQLVPED